MVLNFGVMVETSFKYQKLLLKFYIFLITEVFLTLNKSVKDLMDVIQVTLKRYK